MISYEIREGTLNDLPFLKEMLYEAVFWDPAANRLPMDELFSIPDISNLLSEWKKREGDHAFIAENVHKVSVAAVWYRFSTQENPSFGFIDETTPEIGIAVLPEHRSNGLGTMLMTRIMEYAKTKDIKKISLSVDPNNFALALYRKLGFTKVAESVTSWTMVKEL